MKCLIQHKKESSKLATLSFLINWLYSFFSGIVCLVLIFRRNFLSYTIKFIMIFLLLNLFLCFLVHIFTSWIVYVKTIKIYKILVCLIGFEPTTYRLKADYATNCVTDTKMGEWYNYITVEYRDNEIEKRLEGELIYQEPNEFLVLVLDKTGENILQCIDSSCMDVEKIAFCQLNGVWCRNFQVLLHPL